MITLKVFLLLTLTVILPDTHQIHLSVDLDEKYMHPDFEDNFSTSNPSLVREGEDTHEFWLNLGKDFVRQQKQFKQNTNVAKNIILFLGDGMGMTTLVATRNYIKAEHTKLSFEEYPYTGLSKVYSVDKIVPDSAATATAYLCGVKSNYGTIGVNAAILRGDCKGMKNSSNHVYSIAKWAMDVGKAAGFVTNTRVTHASPAGVYAQTADRNWESNADIDEACGAKHGLIDIAQQLVYGAVGSQLKVIMGGGKSAFIDKNFYENGWRTDGRNLIEEYQKLSINNMYVETKEQLENLDLNKTERLLAIFNDDHLDYHLDAIFKSNNTQPSLEDMTRKAIEFMQQKNENGYFLFIESGRIDMGHHDTKVNLALDETKEFSQTIALARKMTSEEDTLIVVTADHSHTFSVAGYQNRGSDIFSLVKLGADNMPYTPLSYANGNGYYKHFDTKKNKRVNPKNILKRDSNDVFPSTVPVVLETHGGEDVAVFASGPWSHLFTGVYEQNVIPHMMAYAACIGEHLKACDILSSNEGNN